MKTTSGCELEYAVRYVPALAQWDACLLVDRSPRAFALAGTEHAAREEGRRMVRKARENLETGHHITEGL